MIIAAAVLIAAIAGFVQAATGFGAGTVLMLGLPYLFDMLKAPGICQIICTGVNLAIVIQLRHKIALRLAVLPAIMYSLFCVISAGIAKNLDLLLLTIAFGIFLILLGVYSMYFSKKAAVSNSVPAAVGCGAVSGICAGLFGIGGPTMALYMITTTDDRDEYLANLQLVFIIGNIFSTVTRIINGVITVEILPVSMVGVAGVLIGAQLANRVAERMNANMLRSLVYIVTGLTGVLILFQKVPLLLAR